MNSDSKIYVAGHNGMVGSAIVRELKNQGYTNLILRSHKELDVSKAESLGWKYKTSLCYGIKTAYEDFLKMEIR